MKKHKGFPYKRKLIAITNNSTQLEIQCPNCKTILTNEEIIHGFCASCDPAIDSPLDEDFSPQNVLKQAKQVFLEDSEL